MQTDDVPMALAVNPFRKTRTAVEYILRQSKDEDVHLRALNLFHPIAGLEEALAYEPIMVETRIGELRAAIEELVGRSWLEDNMDDPDVRAFRRLDGKAFLSDQDETLARLLWARFGPE